MNANRETTAIPANSGRRAAVIVGILFIVATVTAIIGLLLYAPILAGPDYLVQGFENRNQIALGAVMELILVGSAIGTAVGLFPFVRKYNGSIALAYLLFRFMEAVAIMLGIVSVLSLLTVSREFVAAAGPNVAAFEVAGASLRAIHDWTFILGPHFLLGLNTILYSYLLFKSRLVPRLIAGLGLIGAPIILIVALLEMFGVIPPALVLPLALPVAVYEMVLAGWLIVKGFNPSAIAFTSARTQTDGVLSLA